METVKCGTLPRRLEDLGRSHPQGMVALGICPSSWGVVGSQSPHALGSGGYGWNVLSGSGHVNHYASSG